MLHFEVLEVLLEVKEVNSSFEKLSTSFRISNDRSTFNYSEGLLILVVSIYFFSHAGNKIRRNLILERQDV